MTLHVIRYATRGLDFVLENGSHARDGPIYAVVCLLRVESKFAAGGEQYVEAANLVCSLRSALTGHAKTSICIQKSWI